MTTLADYITALTSLAPGTYPWTGADLTAKETLAVTMALKTHSKHRPRVIVEDVTGDGGFDYDLSDLASWADGFSVVRRVEYPVDDTDEDADVLDDDDWEIYETPDGTFLRFLEDTPEADEEFRVTYTAPHDFSGEASACTVKAFDEEAVQALAASLFLRMLSVYHSQGQDSTISADSVDHQSKAGEYRSQAKMMAQVYYDHVGVKPDGPAPAGFTIAKAPETDRVRLVH
jgi:hypothetical protein